jgi:two-component system OmpR family response regulator/two-component system copper resistance phosphate regulon response regulator CusR
MNILVVEDDPVLRKSLVQGLSEVGHQCSGVRDGAHALRQALEAPPDLIILDVMLPTLSGMEVLRRLRAGGLRLPIIMLTALGAVEDRVTGLSAGADDYVVKPFALAELLARIDAVSRRSRQPSSTLSAAGITLDLTNRRVTRGERAVDLTPTEFSILELLLRHAGQVVTRQMLCEHVWGFTWDGNTNVIEVHVNRLRQKLDAGQQPSCIQTVRGRGYAIRTPA